jgi:N-acetylglucosamine kinase-like BadF-type ATPase
MSQFFLGVDAGGTKTHALVADEAGRAVGFGLGGAGNWQSVGYDGQRAVLDEVVRRALQMAGIGAADLCGAGFGLAGYDWPSQLERHRQSVLSPGLKCPFEIVNDSVVALLAGASQGWGVVLISGTGNNCRGRDPLGREGRISGEGGQFGEFGGASELVSKAVQVVAHEWTQRGPRTILTKMFIEMTGAKDLLDLIEGIDLGRYEPEAGWALAVFQAAYSGDPAAREVIEWSGRELGESACAVIRQLGIQDREFEVVMAGSLFAGGDLYIDPLRETIQKVAPGARLVRLEAPPVVGGVLLGMEQVLGPKAYAHRAQLIETTRGLMRMSEA